jgi:hypothetical protein
MFKLFYCERSNINQVTSQSSADLAHHLSIYSQTSGPDYSLSDLRCTRANNDHELRECYNCFSKSRDLDKDKTLKWIDPFLPAGYVNITSYSKFGWGKKWGAINKNTGGYIMKSSETAQHRGLCGRAGMSRIA